MEASEDQKTSKTRASTPNSNGKLAVANWSPSPTAGSDVDAKLRASSTDISTESDSEKDAAEAYNGVSHKLLGTNRKRGASPGNAGPVKRLQRSRHLNNTTAAESEAIAALEHFKNAEVNPKSRELNNTGKAEAGKVREQGLELPFSAIQNLARLIEAQRRQSELSLQNLRASPFQGRPISPPKADSKTSSELAMRHCFSESSADGLGALSKQDGTALALLQSIAASNQALRNQSNQTGVDSFQSAPDLALTNAMQALDKAPPSFNTFSTYSSSTATDTTFDINAFLSHSSKKPQATPIALGKESGVQTSEPVSTSQKPLLGAFGSVIQDAANRHLPGIGSQKAQYENLAPHQMGELLSNRVSGEMTKQKGFGALKSSVSEGRPPSRGSPHLQVPAGLPDPQILEWIVGSGASLPDKASYLQGPLEGSGIVKPVAEKVGLSALQASVPEARLLGRQDSKPQGGGDKEASTLRRPIAIRPRDFKDAAYLPAAPSEGSLEALLARMHSAAPTSTSPRFSPIQSMGQQPPRAPATPAVAASDLGRVMQWAGTELSLRDQKVREVQRLRSEDRRAHDATLSAVAADVSRLKFGQAQLVKAHRQYQEALAEKDKALGEKDELISGLTRALSELRQQLQRHPAEKQDSDCQEIQEENPLPNPQENVTVHS